MDDSRPLSIDESTPLSVEVGGAEESGLEHPTATTYNVAIRVETTKRIAMPRGVQHEGALRAIGDPSTTRLLSSSWKSYDARTT